MASKQEGETKNKNTDTNVGKKSKNKKYPTDTHLGERIKSRDTMNDNKNKQKSYQKLKTKQTGKTKETGHRGTSEFKETPPKNDTTEPVL